jgi:enoyl-CoA hydratase/carnithine racemase
MFSGRRFDGREAQKMGLALEAVPAGTALSRAQAIATQIASGAPLALRALKKGLGVDRAALQAALEHEARAQAESYGSADLGEGLLAVTERRAPRFTGA